MRGFTLVELMVSLAVVSLVMGGVTGYFIAHRRALVREEQSATLEANLRLAMEAIASDLRASGYGTPDNQLELWIPWVTDFISNPRVTDGGTAPDAITVAVCTPQPVAVLSSNAAAGATSISLASTSPRTIGEQLNATTRRLIRIGEDQFAHVSSSPADSSTATVAIDTQPDPAVSEFPAANPGLMRPHVAGTPVCRVDVRTYSVDSPTHTLWVNEHRGAGRQPLADGITGLDVASGTVTLAGRSERKVAGQYLTRSLVSTIAARNP